eukprot:8975-Heterococcus_DN1.PRE.1
MFLSEISHSWLKAYKKLRYQEIATLSESGLPGGFKILTKCCTCYSAAFASESRLRLAQSRGLHLEADSYKLQRMAGRSASIDVLKVAHDLGLVFTAHVMRGAAESGSIDKIQWLHTEHNCPFPTNITYFAARVGDVRLLKWLNQQQCVFDKGTSMRAVEYGHQTVLEYLHNEGLLQAVHDICEPAAEGGYISVLKFLNEHGYGSLSKRVIENAATCGHVNIMQWLYQQDGVHFDAETMRSAAAFGQLEDSSACTAAAGINKQGIVRWLHEHGCPWDTRELCVYTPYQPSAMLNYMKSKGVHWTTAELTDMLQEVGTKGSLETAKWLRNEGADWPSILKYGDMNWVEDIINWAKEAGCSNDKTLATMQFKMVAMSSGLNASANASFSREIVVIL